MKKVNQAIVKEVEDYILLYTKKKGAIATGRLLAKSYNADAKLNRFLTSDPEQGLKFFTDKVKREAMLEKIDEAYGITSLENKRALVIKMLSEDIDVTIEQLRSDVTAKGTLSLNEEQKGALTKKLVAVRKFLIEKLQPAALEVAEGLGVLVEAEKEVATPAHAEGVQVAI